MRKLAAHLGENEHVTRQIIGELEQMSGHQSKDVNLLSKIHQDSLKIIAELGLDPADTTGEELYEALKAKLTNDIKQLDASWKLNESPELKLNTIAQSLGAGKSVLAIRTAVIKNLIAQQPPKKTMKLLGYRSVDSMIKRGDPYEVVALARIKETKHWLNDFSHAIAKLTPSSFETRQIQITYSDNLDEQISATPLLASIVINPTSINASTVVHLAHLIEEQEAESLYLSAELFKPSFGKEAARVFFAGPKLFKFADHTVVSHRHLHKIANSNGALSRLSHIHPVFHWWKRTSGIAHHAEHLISMNMHDVLHSSLNDIRYGAHSTRHVSDEIKTALFSAYAEQAHIREHLMSNIDGALSEIESLGTLERSAPVFEEV